MSEPIQVICNSPSDIWVKLQAVGALAAVIVALSVVVIQNYLENGRRRREQYEVVTAYIEGLYSLGVGIEEKAKLLSQWCVGGGSANSQDLFFMLKEVETVHIAIAKIPVWALKDFKLVVNATSIQALANTFHDIVKQAEANAKVGMSWAQGANSKLSTVLADLNVKLSELKVIKDDRLNH